MPAPQQIRGSLQILPFLEARLQQVTGLPPECVTFFMTEAPPHLQADQDIIYRRAGWNSDQAQWDGGGNYTKRMQEHMELRLRTRLAVDVTGSASQWTQDPVLGHERMRLLIFAALDGFIPTDAAGNALTTEEMHVKSGQTPKGDNQQAQATNWGEERMSFDLNYLLTFPALSIP